jgi:GTP-binding protein YchF
MGFKCGIVGLPNVGKSTIFNAITSQQVEASNYPFCTIEPNVGVVPLHDEKLVDIFNIIGSAKMTPTTLEFVDIAGLVKGASKGEGLGNQFLNHIQGVDAIAHVVRCFEDSNVAHTTSELDPVSDVEIISLELIMKDLDVVERRIEKLQKLIKTGDMNIKSEIETMALLRQHLSAGKGVRSLQLNDSQKAAIQHLNLLTMKPVMLIANVDEDHLENNEHFNKLLQYANDAGLPCEQFCGKAQAEIAQLDEESRKDFLLEMGLDEDGLSKITNLGYQILDLITFFTANKNEAHAWTITRGTDVRKAAGKVHTDFENNFIRAEVVKYDDLIAEKSLTSLKEKGKIAVHGKEYIVEDSDLIYLRTSA